MAKLDGKGLAGALGINTRTVSPYAGDGLCLLSVRLDNGRDAVDALAVDGDDAAYRVRNVIYAVRAWSGRVWGKEELARRALTPYQTACIVGELARTHGLHCVNDIVAAFGEALARASKDAATGRAERLAAGASK